MGFGIPSFSDIKNAVTSTASSVTNTVTGAASSARDFGSAALDKTKDLASDGVDLGRRAVNAVRSIDVREAASTVRHGIASGIESARGGIKTGVEWTGQRTHETADFARDHVPGGDNVVSNALRGAITYGENNTRFGLGVVGGVTREMVGLAGTVGELGTTAVEMQLSPEARVEYGQKILDTGASAASATGHYLDSVAHDPSRLGSDIGHVAGDAKDWAGGQLDRYEQAFREGKGPETVGMDVGAVATYVVPAGGGPLRGALTAGVRGASEAAVRGGVETVVRGGAEAATRGGGEAVVHGGTEAAAREVSGTITTRVAEASATPKATFGSAASTDYRSTFFTAHPALQGKVVVHHAVEQQVLKRYPGVVSEGQMHSLENLRGIPKEVNADVHLSKIRREWNQFYREHPSATPQQLLDKATEIDAKYGPQFNPPVGE